MNDVCRYVSLGFFMQKSGLEKAYTHFLKVVMNTLRNKKEVYKHKIFSQKWVASEMQVTAMDDIAVPEVTGRQQQRCQ